MRNAIEGGLARDEATRARRVAAARTFSWERNAALTKHIYDEIRQRL